MKTTGISPKVKLPAWALAIIGVALVVLGFILEEETLKEVGFGVIASSGLGAIIGYNADPGEVAFTDENVPGGAVPLQKS